MVLGDSIRHAAMFVLGLLAFVGGASGAETDLNAALQQALEGRGHLGKLLEHVPERTIQNTESATRLVSLLEKTSLEDLLVEVEGVSQLDIVITLFQEAQDAAAIGILTRQGIPHLYRLSNELQPQLSKSSEREFLFLLQVFAGYKTRAGSLRVLRAAREGVLEDHPLWPYVFDPFLFDHNDAVRILQELTKDLPQGQIGRGVLDCANALLAEGGGFEHPFDQDSGVDRLASWLNGSGDDDVSEIQSAVAALPFLKHAKRAELLEVAFHHPHPLVKAEAGWALERLGDSRGRNLLLRISKDVRYSWIARRYLKELGQSKSIPKEVLTPAFLARADLCQFLSHPAENGRPPDQVKILDARSIQWPPTRRKENVWLIQVIDDAESPGGPAYKGIAFVGPRISYQPEMLKDLTEIEQMYGAYCARELAQNADPRIAGQPTPEKGWLLIKSANPKWRRLKRSP